MGTDLEVASQAIWSVTQQNSKGCTSWGCDVLRVLSHLDASGALGNWPVWVYVVHWVYQLMHTLLWLVYAHPAGVALCCLVSSGLSRLGQQHLMTRVLDLQEMLPAACQGAIGVTCSSKDAFLRW
jgi:hypothetical protein